MSEQPTKMQSKEFWEQCGFEVRLNTWFQGKSDDWVIKGGIISLMPSVDLNSLSRYAIPKLIKEYHNWKSVLHDWVDGLTGDYEEDARSLFWILREHLVGKGEVG